MTRAAAAAGLAFLAAAVLLFAVFRSRDGPPRGDLLVAAGRVFDGERVIRDGAVLIRDRKVVAVDERSKLDGRAAQTIALGANATVLPGFVDLHVHAVDDVALVLLSGGVTTVRDVGSPIDVLAHVGSSTPLRILQAGPIVTAPDGYPIPEHGRLIALPVDGESSARAAVRRLARRGASVIKIAVERGDGSYPLLETAEIRAIVDEAHRHDLRVTAHVTAPDDARLALAGGVDELAHMPCAWGAPPLMRELARRGVEIVGTLHVEQDIRCRASLANARAFVRVGGTILYGTDIAVGASRVPSDIDLDELKLMRAAGMTPHAIIRSATSLAGRHTGVPHLGSLVSGAPADLIGVRGNPFGNLQALEQPQLVVAGGVVFVRNGTQTNALLEGL